MIAFLFLVAVIFGYLLGSANSALIVSRYYHVDIRDHGSGNAGATNTLRVLGKTAALITTAGDVAKGFLAYFLGCLLLHGHISLVHLGGLAAGSAAIVGHSWPIYFGFRGGKGSWTSFAVALSFDWRIGVSLLMVFAIVLFFWRIVSLAAIVGAVLLPLFSVVFVGCRAATTIFGVLAVLAVYRHRANIKRILNGHEPKLGER